MGTRIAKYSFIPKENEQIDAVITLAEEPRSVIHGVVKDERGNYIKDAVVKLFRTKDCEDHCALIPVTHTFTDECGQFIFGPLIPGKKYVIKVWVNDVKICRIDENGEQKEDWNEMEADPCTKGIPPQKPKATVNESCQDKYYYK